MKWFVVPMEENRWMGASLISNAVVCSSAELFDCSEEPSSDFITQNILVLIRCLTLTPMSTECKGFTGSNSHRNECFCIKHKWMCMFQSACYIWQIASHCGCSLMAPRPWWTEHGLLLSHVTHSWNQVLCLGVTMLDFGPVELWVHAAEYKKETNFLFLLLCCIL